MDATPSIDGSGIPSDWIQAGFQTTDPQNTQTPSFVRFPERLTLSTLPPKPRVYEICEAILNCTESETMTVDAVAEQILIHHPFSYNTTEPCSKLRGQESTRRTVHHDMSRSAAFQSDGSGNWRLLRNVENKLPSRAGKNVRAKERKARREATTIPQGPPEIYAPETAPSSHGYATPLPKLPPSQIDSASINAVASFSSTSLSSDSSIYQRHQPHHGQVYHSHPRGSSAPTSSRRAPSVSYNPYPRSSWSGPPSTMRGSNHSGNDCFPVEPFTRTISSDTTLPAPSYHTLFESTPTLLTQRDQEMGGIWNANHTIGASTTSSSSTRSRDDAHSTSTTSNMATHHSAWADILEPDYWARDPVVNNQRINSSMSSLTGHRSPGLSSSRHDPGLSFPPVQEASIVPHNPACPGLETPVHNDQGQLTPAEISALFELIAEVNMSSQTNPDYFRSAE